MQTSNIEVVEVKKKCGQGQSENDRPSIVEAATASCWAAVHMRLERGLDRNDCTRSMQLLLSTTPALVISSA